MIARMIFMEGLLTDCERTHLWRDRQGAEGASPVNGIQLSGKRTEDAHIILMIFGYHRSNPRV